MKAKQRERIWRHGKQLNEIFKTDVAPIELCKKLHRIETEAHRKATDYCNGDISTDEWEQYTEKALSRIDKILNFSKKEIPVFINGDARGYALKIRDEYIRENRITIHQDWGGYGILAPEIE